jgi:hypothetical protein
MGTYLIHLVNRLATENVTATLFHGRNFEVNVEENITGNAVTMWTATMTPAISTSPSPFNPLVGPLSQILYDTLIGTVSTVIGGLLRG